MNESAFGALPEEHRHVFLGADHERSERKTWSVIALCGAMMVAEIVGGLLFGSIALVADGLHMSTHAGALLLAALAYSYARRHAGDPRFTFGTGKIGDLAGHDCTADRLRIGLTLVSARTHPLRRSHSDRGPGARRQHSERMAFEPRRTRPSP